MTKYSLPISVSPSGTVHPYLYSPEAGLTIPTGQTLFYGNDFTELIDALAGVQEVEQVDTEFIEDYTVYAEGFWLHVLANATTDIQLTLDEGSGEEHLFYGRVQPGATPLTEHYLGATPLRSGTMHLLSFLTAIQAVSSVNVNTALLATSPPSFVPLNGGGDVYFMLPSIIAQTLSTALGQTYDLSDVVVVGNDFMMTDGINGYAGFELMCTTTLYPHITGRYPLIWDFINSMCMSFGLVPHYWYDVASGRHKIDLLSRGRSYSSNITMPVPTQSDLLTGTPQLIQYIEVISGLSGGVLYFSHEWDEVNQVWLSNWTNTEPNGWKSDLTITMDMGVQGTPPHDTEPTYLRVGDYAYLTVGVEWWDYVLADWAVPVVQMDLAIASYYATRLGQFKRVYERTYPNLKANDGSTNSQANVSLLRNTVINDGVSDRNFYATEVHKNIQTGDLFIRWQEV